MTIPAGEQFYSHDAPCLPGTRCRSASLLPPRLTRSLWPAHPGAAAGPPPTAVSDRSPAGTGEKRAALEALVDHIVPGRSVDTRGSSEGELRIARIVRLPINEASAKLGALRRPNEEPEDLKPPFWQRRAVVRVALGEGAPADSDDDGSGH